MVKEQMLAKCCPIFKIGSIENVLSLIGKINSLNLIFSHRLFFTHSPPFLVKKLFYYKTFLFLIKKLNGIIKPLQ